LPSRDTIYDERSGASRNGFSVKKSTKQPFAVLDQSVPDMACNNDNQAREIVVPAQAGSTLAFMWSPWQVSHKGPILTYMAPYEGDAATVNLQQLKFFKIQERGLLRDNSTWATDEMIQNSNVSWATIPHDIKPGKYIVRHEIIGLHFATEDSVWTRLEDDAVLGPQVWQHNLSTRPILTLQSALHPMH
jgi:hypothetical protein